MFLGRGGVVVCFSLSHVGISMVFWERSTLVQVFTWKVRKKWRCVKSRCSSRLRVNEKDNVISSSQHNHEQGRTETKSAVSEIRKKSGEKLLIPQNSGTVPASDYSTSDRLEKKMILIEPRQMDTILSRPDSEILHRERQTMFKPNIVAKVKDM